MASSVLWLRELGKLVKRFYKSAIGGVTGSAQIEDQQGSSGTTMRKEIVVIGGGFAGINLVKRLADASEFHVTLVDRNNYNTFPPLLYQVATSFLETSNICYPFRKLFHGAENVNFHLGELQRVLLKENKVVLTSGELPYDFLVLATGTESNYFGMENIRQAAFPLKTVDDAIEIRNHMLQKMEEASRVTEEAERKKLTTVVIAGGGPTGVEIAGMLAEMRENILEKDYPELRDHCPMIYLVDGSPSLLSAMSEKAQQYAYDTHEDGCRGASEQKRKRLSGRYCDFH
jgi:NADH dehydrogenase